MDNQKKIEILKLAQGGDSEAIADLYSLCADDLYFYAYQVLRNTSQAEVVVEETLANMCKQKSVPASPDQFSPWMMYFCHLRCRRFIDGVSSSPDLGGMLESEAVAVDSGFNGSIPSDLCDQLKASMESMPREERAATTLVYYEGFTVEQAAMILGWKPQYAEAYKCSAIRTMKAIVQNYYAKSKSVTNASIGQIAVSAMASIYKENPFDGKVETYRHLCENLGCAESEKIVGTPEPVEEEKKETPAAVVFNSNVYKESFGDKIKALSAGAKAAILAAMCLVIGAGIVLGIKFLGPNKGPKVLPETSTETSINYDDITITKYGKRTTKTYPTDENGNEIRPTIKVAKNSTRAGAGVGSARTTKNRQGGGGAGIGVATRRTAGGNNGVTRARYTTTLKNAKTRAVTTGKTQAKRPASMGGQGDNTRAGGNSINVTRPATPTTNAGSPVTRGLKSGNYTYTIYSNGSVHISDFSGSGSVSIPSAIDGKTVSGIDEAAFKNNTGISSVKIPNSVSIIADHAFSGCTGLRSVTLGSGIITIGQYAFKNCSSISTIAWPSSLTRIGGSAFYGCSSLTTCKLPDTIKNIESMAFRDCSSITSAVLPRNLAQIENNMFYGCSSLQSVTIGSAVQKIGNGAFYGCSNLKTVNFRGSKAQWDSLPFDTLTNRPLESANVVYNY